jgi:2-hydroxymuconate-semialdehyde hydrolase
MTAESGTFETSAGSMAFRDQGEGKPVLLIHGFPTSAHLWRNFVDLFAGRYRTVTLDLIGYGRSAKPDDAALDIRAQAGYVGELLDELGIDGELAVVGHDIGGGVAQLLAFEGRATALVLIDSISFDSWPIEGVRMIQQASDDAATPEFAEGLIRVAIELGISKKDRVTDELIGSYAEPFTGPGGPEALIRAARGIDGQGLIGTEAKLADLGERLLVLWGEDDPYQDQEWAWKMSDLVQAATVGILPGCSHYLPEDAPETIGPLAYEWLRVRYLAEPHHHAGDGVGPVPVDVSFERPDPPEDFE